MRLTSPLLLLLLIGSAHSLRPAAATPRSALKLKRPVFHSPSPPTLVAAATGLDPFARDDDDHGLLFINKTGRDRGVRAEAGVLAGPRAGVAYALVVCFDDLSILHRLRAHDAFRTLGVDLMEYVF